MSQIEIDTRVYVVRSVSDLSTMGEKSSGVGTDDIVGTFP